VTVTDTTLLEAVLRRDRLVVIAALVAVVVAAWVWIALGAGTGMSAVAMTQMAGLPDMDLMMASAVWTPAYAGLIFAMWWVMMVAMMLPGAAPMLLVFARVNRAQKDRDRPYVPTGIFAAGYLAAWGGFSTLAAALQWGLEQLDELLARWCDPPRRRRMATHPDEGRLPATLPLASELPCPEMATRPARSLLHGARTRHLLSGMLLVPDGPVILWRHHELVLDCWSCLFCPVGEDDPNGPLDRADCRHRSGCLGYADARQRSW